MQHRDGHGMISGDLKVQVQDDSGNPRAVNCSPGVSYWPLNQCNLGSCLKPVLEITQRIKDNIQYTQNTLFTVKLDVMWNYRPMKKVQGACGARCGAC